MWSDLQVSELSGSQGCQTQGCHPPVRGTELEGVQTLWLGPLEGPLHGG